MWTTKDSEHIIYIDMERKLAVKPTILADNTCTPFPSNFFDTIFYDPPHGWGAGHPFYKYPDTKSFKEAWAGYGEIPRYYGWDKFRSKSALIKHLFNANLEFQRILKPDGLLWIKWNETTLNLRSVLAIFYQWRELLTIPVSHEVHTAGKQKTYWVCLVSKIQTIRQSSALEFM